MDKYTNNEKIKLIKKYFKKDYTFLELSLKNYESYNIYIILIFNKKMKYYRLYWFDLSLIIDDKIEKYISCSSIPTESIESIKEAFSEFIVSSEYKDSLVNDEDIVELKAHLSTKVDSDIDVCFKKYLPTSLAHLFDLLCFIFRNMPKKFEGFLFELVAKLTKTTEKYEYKKEFEFDLFNDDIDKIFSYQIIQRGKKYYEESRIEFLEKIDDRYFAIVNGTEKYLVIIKYTETDENKKMQVYCSCPCEFYCKHIYSVLLSIRNKEEKRFYKIMYKNPDKSLLERVMEFDYFLCLGVVEQNLEIINNYGEIELVPILDYKGRCNWTVLEDTENEKLTKEIKYFLDNN